MILNPLKTFIFKKNARGRHTGTAFALFLLLLGSPAYADTIDLSLGSYVLRMAISLALLAGLGYLVSRYAPKHIQGLQSQKNLRVLGMLRVGRDAVYILKTGPQVTAVLVGRGSNTVLGQWSQEEWDDHEELDISKSSGTQ